MGSKGDLLRTLAAVSGVKSATPGVRSSVLKWRRTQSSRTSLRRPKFSDNANPFAINVFWGGLKRRLFALFIALEHSSLQCVSRS